MNNLKTGKPDELSPEMYIVNELIAKLVKLYEYQEVYSVLQFMMLDIEDGTGRVKSHGYQDKELLEVFFDTIFTKKGVQWLSILEPLTSKLTLKCNISMPGIYGLSLKKMELKIDELNRSIKRLREENENLRFVVKDAEEKMMRDPVTRLYNMNCFNGFMADAIKRINPKSQDENLSLISISIDNLAKIKYMYGDSEVDEVLKNTAYLLNGINHEGMMRFRLQGSTFGVTIENMTKQQTVELAEKIRNKVAFFEGYIEAITVSVGVVTLRELLIQGEDLERAPGKMYEVAMARLGIAKNRGMNVVCSQSDMIDHNIRIGKVLLVDNDKTNIEFLKNYLEHNNFKVFTANNGLDAYECAKNEMPDVIISDIMLPKMDGFSFRKKLIDDSLTKNSLFIFLSHLKDEDSVTRALSLDVDFYFKKPYMAVEIVGIIKNRMKGVALK